MHRFFAALIAIVITGCGPTPEEMGEMRTQLRQVLAKLEQIEKKLDQASARPAAPAAARDMPDPNKIYDLPVARSAVRGPADAPVSLVMFSDYQCPFCARAEPLIADVLKAYPKNVKLVYKNFPLTSIHPNAMGAAKAAVAAGKQGKYWEMNDKLFANQKALGADQLKLYAAQIGLDVPRWETDMKSQEVEAVVLEEMSLAGKADVRGTPTFFVNGKRVQNRSVEGFKEMVDDALKGKKAG